MLELIAFIKGILVRNESDKTKTLSVEVSDSATTETRTTLQSKQTADRTLELPDVDGELVEKDASQILTTKTIDSANNTLTIDADEATVSNLVTGNLKAGVLVTDVSTATADTELPSALAVKTALEGQNEASEIVYDNSTSGLTATDVQNAVDEVEGRLDTAESNVSTNASDIITKANRELDNLQNTAINTDILPDTDISHDIGSASLRFDDIHSERLLSGELIVSRTNNHLGVNAPRIEGNASGGGLGTSVTLQTPNDNNATRSGNLYFLTGDNAGTGVTGDLWFVTGTPTSGNRGKLRFQDGSEGTPGHVWTSTDSNGTGEWLPASGGSGSKNYFSSEDRDLDLGIGNWETDDGAGIPSAGLTLSTTSLVGELLAGTASLKLVKDAADRNGHFIKVRTETIDPIDRDQALFGSFKYKYISGTYTDGDLLLEVYDVTNATVLFSGPAESNEISQGEGRFDYVAYLDATTAEIEFRIKVNTTDSNAIEFTFDEFTLGPSSFLAPAISTNELALQSVRMRYTLTTYTQPGVSTTLPFPNKVYDTANIYDTGTGEVTIPKTGYYEIKSSVLSDTAGTDAGQNLNVVVNGTTVAFASETIRTTGSDDCSIDITLYLQKDDTVRIQTSNSQSTDLIGGANANYFEIEGKPDYSVFGVVRNDEFISLTSDTKTPLATGDWLQMTNNSITLTPGTWRIDGVIDFNNSAGTADYTQTLGKWASVNGNDTSTDPTATTVEAGLDTGGSTLSSAVIEDSKMSMPTIRKTVGNEEILYLVPRVQLSTPSDGRVTTYIYAERIK